MKKNVLNMLTLVAVIAGLSGCSLKTENTVKVEPIEIKPIHITINVKVEKELDDFFSDIDEAQ
ncbi:MAG: hypothetical protein PHV75_03610 [Victivallaceae bacterium]|jgi:type IV pilus biogenesis protein CpaD/CtpE|nr:hypothetical protein [Victivallaceae bacterium]MDD3702674.1 hypothetical protein [Victivallaceae bacterium]MDD4317584.1 hypothetical protein [Victivallaceae bacterium]MDD5662829.1 hypothetical protein [Victivallaceae bacterium]